ncbi:MAG: DUF2384 domain-containing protein [Treponema sp.]|nr:DUF2384 domain-containing protein [Treponema sp.]
MKALAKKYSPAKCILLLADGVKKRQYNELVHAVFKFTDKDFASIAGTSARTLSRLKSDQNIPSQAAEVTISLMRAYSRAIEIFGSEDNAVAWLKTPNAILNNLTPVQALSSRFGAEEVMDMLGRIEYGVYS